MKKKKGIVFLLAVAMLFSSAIAEGKELSKYHQLNIDPYSKNKVSEEAINEVIQFFHDAELAIETKNIEALMNMYSNNYQNGIHNKGMVEATWNKLFSDFNSLSTIHNLTFVTSDSARNVLILRCTGLLMGQPKKGKEIISLDTWNNNNHVLTKEDGKWRIMGNVGLEQKRFWFSEPLHPLF